MTSLHVVSFPVKNFVKDKNNDYLKIGGQAKTVELLGDRKYQFIVHYYN